VYVKNGPPRTLSILNPLVDAMAYPIVMAHGEFGFEIGLQYQQVATGNVEEEEDVFQEPSERTRCVTMREFYAYRLCPRKKTNYILKYGRLTQLIFADIGQRIMLNRYTNYINL
jgi:hypothetical protein